MLTAVRVAGDSMLPVLRPGDLLLVRPRAPIRPGDLVIARRPYGLIVKRAFRLTPEGWWLESDNQSAPGRQDSWDFGAYRNPMSWAGSSCATGPGRPGGFRRPRRISPRQPIPVILQKLADGLPEPRLCV